MNKYLLIILLVLVVVAVVASGLFFYLSKQEENREEAEETQELVFFQNQDWGFEFSYPSDWREKSTPKGEKSFSFGIAPPIEEKSGGPAASFYFVAFEPKQGQILEDTIQVSINQLSADNLLVSQKEVEISGFGAKELVYIDKAENPDSKEVRYFIDRGGVWYQIFYTAKIDKFNQYLPVVEQIISTTKITK